MGDTLLAKALDQFPHADQIDVRYRSYQLMPHLPVDGGVTATEILVREKGIPRRQADAMNAQVEARAKGPRRAPQGAFEEDVAADQKLGRDLGISGVPFFVLDGKYAITRAQPVGAFGRALETAWRAKFGVSAALKSRLMKSPAVFLFGVFFGGRSEERRGGPGRHTRANNACTAATISAVALSGYGDTLLTLISHKT